MKNKLLNILFTLSLISLMGFTAGDEVELDSFLSSDIKPELLRYMDTSSRTLKAGTVGEVVEIIKFKTENFGVKIKANNSSESYWVYYNKKDPAIKLSTQEMSKEIGPDDIELRHASGEPQQKIIVEVKRDVTGKRDPKEHAILETVKVASETLEREVLQEIVAAKTLPCVTLAEVAPPIAEQKNNPQQEIQSPKSLLNFERSMARIKMGCGGSGFPQDGFVESLAIDCKTGAKYPAGVKFSDNPGHPYLGNAVTKYPDGSKPRREIEFVSRDHASNETYLYLTDMAGGDDSHDVKSIMLLLPRKGVPFTEVVGEEVVVTMTTGEKVIFDKKTHAIKSGALKEGPIDLTRDRFKRQPPNIQYTGEGISIRVNHRYEFPTAGAESADVRQGSRVCKIPRGQLWNKDGDLLSDNDNSLLKVLNQKCPPKAAEKAFHL